VKISTPWVCTGFGWKEEFRVGEKEFVWGSKPDKTICAKAWSNQEQVATAWVKPGLSLD
jgi:hypothetical protein